VRVFQGLVHLGVLHACTGCLRPLQHAWLQRWVVDGEVAPAALKRKEQAAARASEERVNLLLASVAAALPLAVLLALRMK
jgi:hypothetical protein